MSFATALSITAHESPITIIDQCLNNLIVGQFDAIAIHINRNAKFDMDALARLIDATPLLRGVVHINPERLPTDYLAPGLLHRAHVSNFRFLLGKTQFDVFCTDASNTILIRNGLKPHLERERLGIDNTSAFGWNSTWESNLRKDLLFERCGDACRYSQMEGMCVPTEMFQRVAHWIDDFDRELDRRIASGVELAPLPREEYLFSTGLDQLGVQLSGTPYILSRHGSVVGYQVFSGEKVSEWQSVLGQGQKYGWESIEVEQTLRLGRMWLFYWDLIADHVPPISNIQEYREGKFGIRQVAASMEDPIRAMVGNHFGYRQASLQAAALL